MANRNYVENAELLRELQKYKETDKASQLLHEMFLLMAKRISLKGAYREKPYRDDMIGDAYIKCIQKAFMFDLSKTNPFAYFQSIIENLYKDIIFKTERERIYQTQLYLKTRNDISEHYKVHESLTMEIKEEINNEEIKTSIWKQEFINFLNENGENWYQKMTAFFVGENYDLLLSTEGQEIIYFNIDCDNKNGHCICSNCEHHEFENRIGKALMQFRQELIDIKGLE